MKKISLLIGLFALLSLGLVSGASLGYRFTNSTNSVIFSISPVGNINATGWIAESGVQLTNLYCALTGCTMTGNFVTSAGINLTAGTGGYFKGDGSLLTGITIAANSTLITYQNVTTWPACSANQHLDSDGATLSCTTTVDVESDPIWSANFTNMQTDCPTGNYTYGVLGNGTLKCRSDLQGTGGISSYTNIAMLNQTNLANITINDTFHFKWAPSNASITANSLGDITFKLGG